MLNSLQLWACPDKLRKQTDKLVCSMVKGIRLANVECYQTWYWGG